jgi:hypothetical protein
MMHDGLHEGKAASSFSVLICLYGISEPAAASLISNLGRVLTIIPPLHSTGSLKENWEGTQDKLYLYFLSRLNKQFYLVSVLQ